MFSGEEFLLFSLCRLAYPSRLQDLADNYFGRDGTQWSRAFAWFLRHLLVNFQDLMMDNLDYWVPYFPECAEKIRLKLAEHGLQYEPGEFAEKFRQQKCVLLYFAASLLRSATRVCMVITPLNILTCNPLYFNLLCVWRRYICSCSALVYEVLIK